MADSATSARLPADPCHVPNVTLPALRRRPRVLYRGEGNESAAALALAVSRIPGMRLTLAAPEGYGLDPAALARARALSAEFSAMAVMEWCGVGVVGDDL